MDLLHLQAAGCGRASRRTIAAVTAYLEREAADGGYVAEEAAEVELTALRAGVGSLFGHASGSVFLTTGATDSLSHLLRRWPLAEGAEVAVTPGEWGPNLAHLAARGLAVRVLPVDDDGVLDLSALEQQLRTRPPAVVHLVQLASHRALRQPIEQALAICRAAGVPLWVDAAQSFAHLPTAFGADAVYAPARKWLAAPRGVGFLAVAEQWRDRFAGIDEEEAAVAGWFGAAQALADLAPDHVDRLAEIGCVLRTAVADLPGWELADPHDATGALVGLRPLAGQDVVAEQRRLLQQHRILTTACETWRAPADMPVPLLRLAPASLDTEGVARLTESLRPAKHPAG